MSGMCTAARWQLMKHIMLANFLKCLKFGSFLFIASAKIRHGQSRK